MTEECFVLNLLCTIATKSIKQVLTEDEILFYNQHLYFLTLKNRTITNTIKEYLKGAGDDV